MFAVLILLVKIWNLFFVKASGEQLMLRDIRVKICLLHNEFKAFMQQQFHTNCQINEPLLLEMLPIFKYIPEYPGAHLQM